MKGSSGRGCLTCSPNYGREHDNPLKCGKCSPLTGQAVKLLLYCVKNFGLILWQIVMVYGALNRVADGRSLQANFGGLLSKVLLLNCAASALIRDAQIVSAEGAVAPMFSYPVYSPYRVGLGELPIGDALDCITGATSEQDRFMYRQLLMIGVPLAMSVLVVCFAVCAFPRSKGFRLSHFLVASLLLTVYLFLHVGVRVALESSFPCFQLDWYAEEHPLGRQGTSARFLGTRTDVECSLAYAVSSYWASTSLVSIVVLLAFGAGIMNLMYIKAIKPKEVGEDWKLYTAYFASGLRPQYWYWDFVMLATRMAFVAADVTLPHADYSCGRTCAGLFILVVSAFLQRHHRPFAIEWVNTVQEKVFLTLILAALLESYVDTARIGYEEVGVESNVLILEVFRILALVLKNLPVLLTLFSIAHFYYKPWAMLVPILVNEFVISLRARKDRTLQMTGSLSLRAFRSAREN